MKSLLKQLLLGATVLGILGLFYVKTSRVAFHQHERFSLSLREFQQQDTELNDQQLLEISQQAGMAEVATGVLHNVGNVLNSVNVSATLIGDTVKKSKIANLARVTTLFQEHQTDLGDYLTRDAKGRQLPGYLGQLAEHLGREQEGTLLEIESLRKNMEHIKEIVLNDYISKPVDMAELRAVMHRIFPDCYAAPQDPSNALPSKTPLSP